MFKANLGNIVKQWLKIKCYEKAGDIACDSVVGYLPITCEALGSILSTLPKPKSK